MNLNLLPKLLEDGYLRASRHPTLPLTIYNYSQTCQFEGHWTPETKACRGLVLDDSGKIWARPFEKFFNLEEHQYKVPDEPFEVFEKVDGSLGIIFWYEPTSEWVFASRGSFISDQAIEFKKIWKEKKYSLESQRLDFHGKVVGLTPGFTYLFEILYPENRIVVCYEDQRDVILLGCIHTESNQEMALYSWTMTPVAKRFHFNSIDEVLKSDALDNAEGYVVRFKSGFRVKIKFAEYKRLHKLITEASNISIWEALMNKTSFDELLEKVPDEFYKWVATTKATLEAEYSKVETKAKQQFNTLMRQKFQSRKDQANFICNSCAPDLKGILFLMLDERDYSEFIWKAVKPNYERPIWQTDNP